VNAIDMSVVAASRALACAGLSGADVDLIIYGSCSNDEGVPNSASGVQIAIGATRAAAMDVNTACTSFCYGLATATAMIRSGMVKNAVVIGVELISRFMDWSNRNVAVLFGDGAAAVVLQATDSEEGLLGSVLGCDAEARETLRVRGLGLCYANSDVRFGDTLWDFDGQAIFKRAVQAMAEASKRVLEEQKLTPDEISLVVPHQANLRIIEAVASRVGLRPEQVMVTIDRFGNTTSASIPSALCVAREEGRLKKGDWVVLCSFGAGFTWGATLLRWTA
jgi:3-oxoacyl-[acyl-carrier-protein] synthase-3